MIANNLELCSTCSAFILENNRLALEISVVLRNYMESYPSLLGTKNNNKEP